MIVFSVEDVMKRDIIINSILCIMVATSTVSANIIRGIEIDFVYIADPDNPADSTGYGAVGREFNITVYEITNDQWDQFVAVAGGGNNSAFNNPQQPVNNVSWFDAAYLCNYLTSGDRSQGVYLFAGNNEDPGDFIGIDRITAEETYGTVFFIPTENEWYKAAYYDPNSENYSLFPNGQDTLPPADEGWNYKYGSYSGPWDVGTGTTEQNGTYDMAGNMWEWTETVVGAQSQGVIRGGSFTGIASNLNSGSRFSNIRGSRFYNTGFRIAAYNLCGDPQNPYPEGDYNGDCHVNMFDLAEIATGWLITYEMLDAAKIAENWLDCTDPSGCE